MRTAPSLVQGPQPHPRRSLHATDTGGCCAHFYPRFGHGGTTLKDWGRGQAQTRPLSSRKCGAIRDTRRVAFRQALLVAAQGVVTVEDWNIIDTKMRKKISRSNIRTRTFEDAVNIFPTNNPADTLNWKRLILAARINGFHKIHSYARISLRRSFQRLPPLHPRSGCPYVRCQQRLVPGWCCQWSC